MKNYQIVGGIAALTLAISASPLLLSLNVGEGRTANPSHFSEPSARMDGTKIGKERSDCVAKGGNFYFHGEVVCEFNQV